MQVQHSIKKVGAVAGSALMAGMSLGAAASLADFPAPFTDDGQVQSQIVVGTDGNVADVVGAVNVAGAVGQSAVQTTEETVEGEDTTEVDGTSFDQETIGGQLNAENLDAFDVPQLEDTEFNDGNNHLEETLDVNVTFDQRSEQDSYDVSAAIAQGDIAHHMWFDQAVEPQTTVPVGGEDLIFLRADASNGLAVFGSSAEERSMNHGEVLTHDPYEAEITNYGGDWVEVSVSKDGEHVESVILDDPSSDSVDGDYDSQYTDDSELDVQLHGQRININDELVAHVKLVWENTVFEEGETTPLDDNYEVSSLGISNGDLTDMHFQNAEEWVVWTNDEEEEVDDRLQTGDAAPGYNGEYDITYHGLEDVETEDASLGSGAQVSWTDDRDNSHTVNLAEEFVQVSDYDTSTDGDSTSTQTVQVLTNYTGTPALLNAGDGDLDAQGQYFEVHGQYAAQVADVADNGDGTYNVTVSLLDREETFTVGDAETLQVKRFRRGVYIGLDATQDDAGDVLVHAGAAETGDEDANELGDNQQIDAAEEVGNFETRHGAMFSIADTDYDGDGTTETVVTVDEDDGGANNVAVVYDGNNDVSAVHFEGSTNAIELAEEEFSVTDWGTQAEFASADSVTLTYPQERVNAEASVGEVTTTAGEDVTYQAVDESAQGMLPAMGALDEEVNSGDKESDHLVLVGGPAVNTLVGDLADADKTWGQSDYQDEGAGYARVEMVEDAFVEGQHAMVVAGHSADDTRAASKYVANYGANADELANQDDGVLELRSSEHSDVWD